MSRVSFILNKTMLLLDSDELTHVDYIEGVITFHFRNGSKQEYECDLDVARIIVDSLGDALLEDSEMKDLSLVSGISFPVSDRINIDEGVKETGLKFLHSLSNTNNE